MLTVIGLELKRDIIMSQIDPLEVILSGIETLDKEMTNHEESCSHCSNHGPCNAWVDMIETWNFYYTSMTRYVKNNTKALTYE